MTPKQKIEFADHILEFIAARQVNKERPEMRMIGHLNKPQGIIGFKKADVGTPVFETSDRYLLILESNDGKSTIDIKYHKKDLESSITFI